MPQSALNREVASVTGESVQTISNLGFVPLTHIPFERDREPLVVDWDEKPSQPKDVGVGGVN